MRAVSVVGGVLLCAGPLQAQTKEKLPSCRADKRGQEIVTRIDYPNGYSIEGPWHVTATGGTNDKRTITASLDRIVEIDALTNAREMTPLPGPVEMTFRGATQSAALDEAAQLWCATIITAKPPQLQKNTSFLQISRITP